MPATERVAAPNRRPAARASPTSSLTMRLTLRPPPACARSQTRLSTSRVTETARFGMRQPIDRGIVPGAAGAPARPPINTLNTRTARRLRRAPNAAALRRSTTTATSTSTCTIRATDMPQPVDRRMPAAAPAQIRRFSDRTAVTQALVQPRRRTVRTRAHPRGTQ